MVSVPLNTQSLNNQPEGIAPERRHHRRFLCPGAFAHRPYKGLIERDTPLELPPCDGFGLIDRLSAVTGQWLAFSALLNVASSILPAGAMPKRVCTPTHVLLQLVAHSGGTGGRFPQRPKSGGTAAEETMLRLVRAHSDRIDHRRLTGPTPDPFLAWSSRNSLRNPEPSDMHAAELPAA